MIFHRQGHKCVEFVSPGRHPGKGTWGFIIWYQPSEWREPSLLKGLSLCLSLSLSSLWVVDQPQETLSCVRLPSISVSSLWWWTDPICAFVSGRKRLIGFLYFAGMDCFTERRIIHWYCAHTVFKFVCVCACMCVLLIPGGLSHGSLSD